jgi:peptide deformylase
MEALTRKNEHMKERAPGGAGNKEQTKVKARAGAGDKETPTFEDQMKASAPGGAGDMKVLTLGDEQLKARAHAVSHINEECVRRAAVMLEIVHKKRGVGLAAPQIGVLERMFVVHVPGDEPRVFINPSIIETSEDQVSCEEGCLSVPGVWAELLRPKSVKVQAWNEQGRPFTLQAGGMLSRVIQHEYDHLEGVLFVDRLSAVRRERLLAKYEKLSSRKKGIHEDRPGSQR